MAHTQNLVHTCWSRTRFQRWLAAGLYIQVPVVQKLDSAIHRISIAETNCATQWKKIYPVDSATHLLNNRGGQKLSFVVCDAGEEFSMTATNHETHLAHQWPGHPCSISAVHHDDHHRHKYTDYQASGTV